MVDDVALETHGRSPPGGCPRCPEAAVHYVCVKPATSRSAKCVGGPDQGGPTRSGTETTWFGHPSNSPSRGGGSGTPHHHASSRARSVPAVSSSASSSRI